MPAISLPVSQVRQFRAANVSRPKTAACPQRLRLSPRQDLQSSILPASRTSRTTRSGATKRRASSPVSARGPPRGGPQPRKQAGAPLLSSPSQNVRSRSADSARAIPIGNEPQHDVVTASVERPDEGPHRRPWRRLPPGLVHRPVHPPAAIFQDQRAPAHRAGASTSTRGGTAPASATRRCPSAAGSAPAGGEPAAKASIRRPRAETRPRSAGRRPAGRRAPAPRRTTPWSRRALRGRCAQADRPTATDQAERRQPRHVPSFHLGRRLARRRRGARGHREAIGIVRVDRAVARNDADQDRARPESSWPAMRAGACRALAARASSVLSSRVTSISTPPRSGGLTSTSSSAIPSLL